MINKNMEKKEPSTPEMYTSMGISREVYDYGDAAVLPGSV